MEQENFDEVQMELNKDEETELEKIQKMYVECLKSEDDEKFLDLMEVIDSMFIPWSRKQLEQRIGYYDAKYIDDIMQESRLNLWRDIRKTKEMQSEPRETYGKYAYGIYKKSMSQALRKHSNGKKNVSVKLNSLDAMKGTGREVQGKNKFEYVENKEEIVQKERAYFYSYFLDVYLQHLMESDESPENCLAVMYARVLPHVTDQVRESIMSSVKWARKQMGKNNIGDLTLRSESLMNVNGFLFYKWGVKYLEQLDKKVIIAEKEYTLRDVIFLDAYDNGRKFEHMDRDTHKIIQRNTFEKLIKDPKFVSLGLDYLDKDDRMYKLIGGER